MWIVDAASTSDVFPQHIERAQFQQESPLHFGFGCLSRQVSGCSSRTFHVSLRDESAGHHSCSGADILPLCCHAPDITTRGQEAAPLPRVAFYGRPAEVFTM